MKEREIKIIEVKSEIGAGTRGASMGVEAMKIASLDLKSDLFRQYDSVEVENVNELLFDSRSKTLPAANKRFCAIGARR